MFFVSIFASVDKVKSKLFVIVNLTSQCIDEMPPLILFKIKSNGSWSRWKVRIEFRFLSHNI